jgi:hypothetical protein
MIIIKIKWLKNLTVKPSTRIKKIESSTGLLSMMSSAGLRGKKKKRRAKA